MVADFDYWVTGLMDEHLHEWFMGGVVGGENGGVEVQGCVKGGDGAFEAVCCVKERKGGGRFSDGKGVGRGSGGLDELSPARRATRR